MECLKPSFSRALSIDFIHLFKNLHVFEKGVSGFLIRNELFLHILFDKNSFFMSLVRLTYILICIITNIVGEYVV